MQVWDGDYRGIPVSLVRSGMGRKAAEQAAAYALKEYPQRMVISFGFAGGLQPEIVVGDLALPERIDAQASGEAAFESLSLEPFEALLAAVHADGLNPYAGALLTAPRVVGRSDERRILADLYHAQTVDMESYWVGMAAAAAGRRFLSVRAISDVCSEDLPRLDSWVAGDGRLRPEAAIRHFITNPNDITAVVRLARGVKAARAALEHFFRAGLPVLAGVS